MRIIIQRVKKASCIVNNQVIGKIEEGLMLLVGFTRDDNLEKVSQAAKKISCLRIFDDELGKMNKSILDIGGSILSISQFTLYANTQKGNRPSFIDSMHPQEAKILYENFNETLENDYQINIQTGSFGSHMNLEIVCDGPVTITLEF